MYLDHFKLTRPPFQSKPDPEFLYLSKAHALAQTYLDYTAWNKDGFAVISGEIGSGKTTLINHLISRLDEHVLVIKIHQTQLTEEQFLQTLLSKFGIEAFEANKAKLLRLIDNFFDEQHSRGQKILLIVDEAHHLGQGILEEIRFLTGIEIDGEQIFTCILTGHTELMDILDAPGMEQLSQRVRLRFHIPALSEEDTRAYIGHRLRIAGHKNPSSTFPRACVPLIYQYTGGIPRLINILCDASMIAAYAEDVHTISKRLIEMAIEELQWKPYSKRIQKETSRSNILSVVDTEVSCPKILLTQGGDMLEEIPLRKNHITIGRLLSNDITLAQGLVSRYHAKIMIYLDRIVLEDLASKNGTFVNGKKIKSHALSNRDKIRIGNFELELVTNNSSKNSSSEATMMMPAN